MTRAGFFAALGSVITIPFISKEESKPHTLPRDRFIEPEDVEELVRKEIDRKLTLRINGKEIAEIIKLQSRK